VLVSPDTPYVNKGRIRAAGGSHALDFDLDFAKMRQSTEIGAVLHMCCGIVRDFYEQFF